MKVAIDGPAGSGKSTVAKEIATRKGFTYLDTGAMYRALTLKSLYKKLDARDVDILSELARNLDIRFSEQADGQHVFLDGKDVTHEIRTAEVDRAVSAISAVPAVREALVQRQQKLSQDIDVVAEGRDIGTVVFPDAELKIFLVAAADARAERRALQRAKEEHGPDAQVDPQLKEEILSDLLRRDQFDSSRATSPLRAAEDAITIDSSTLSAEEVVQIICGYIDKKQSKQQEEKPQEKSQGKAQDKAHVNLHNKADQKPSRPKKEQEVPQRLRAFHHNSFDDYRDTSMKLYPLPARAFFSFVILVVTFFSKLFWPWKIEDGEKLWNSREGRVLIMNHVSMLDPVIVVASLWFHGISVRPIYKSEFDHVRIVSWLFSRAGGIPVVRGSADIKAVRRAERALKRGECVLIYPEGTRIKSDDEPVEIHGGFALMAHMAKATVQPIAIVGARDITPRGKVLKRLGRVWCKAGDPLSFDELPSGNRKAKIAAMEQVAMERVYELRNELREEHPGKM